MLTPLRMALLLVIAVLGGVVMGGLSGLVAFPPAGLVIGGVFGAVVGFISLGIVAPALAHKSLLAGVFVMYPLALIVAMLFGSLGPDVAISASGAALAIGALVAHFALKNTWPPVRPGHCRACGHDLGDVTDRCPECGASLTAPAKERRWEPLSAAWLVAVCLALLGLSAVTVPPALNRATLGYATNDPKRLTELMGDHDMETSYNAAEKLKRIDHHALIEALSNPNDDVRRQAAYSMRRGYEDDPEAIDALIGVLNDPDAHVRYEATVTLGSIADPSALPALRQVVNTDPSTMVVRGATEAIVEIGQRHPSVDTPDHGTP